MLAPGHRGHLELVMPEVGRQQSAVRARSHCDSDSPRFVLFLYNVYFWSPNVTLWKKEGHVVTFGVPIIALAVCLVHGGPSISAALMTITGSPQGSGSLFLV